MSQSEPARYLAEGRITEIDGNRELNLSPSRSQGVVTKARGQPGIQVDGEMDLHLQALLLAPFR